MTAPEYVTGCAAENMQQDGTCSVPVWLPYPQPILPPLSIEQGITIAFAIVSVWALGLGARLVFRSVERSRY